MQVRTKRTETEKKRDKGTGFGTSQAKELLVQQSGDDGIIIIKKIPGQPPELWGCIIHREILSDAVNPKLLQSNLHTERE
jgi:hypothetical protein